MDDIAHCFVDNKFRGLVDIVNSISHDYIELQRFVKSGQSFRDKPDKHVSQLYKLVIDRLSIHSVNDSDIVVLDGTRILVLPAARKDIACNLHPAHSGLTKTIKTASQLYY